MFLHTYQSQLDQRQFSFDPAQQDAAHELQRVYEQLTRSSRGQKLVRDWLNRLKRSRASGDNTGLWLWGSVGSGKTYMMDMFFNALPIEQKRRMHFHRFMRHVHYKLKAISEKQNPLDLIAAHFAKRYRVLCLDEFFVLDVADAMLLAGLMEGLFKRGVTLVTTSNSHPDDLYEGGLQRQRFLPAIELIKAHMTVFELSAACDYRLHHLGRTQTYCLSDQPDAEQHLKQYFNHLASHVVKKDTSVEVEGRRISVKRLSHDAIWFDFDALCQSPRCTSDYIAISRCFHTVLISNIPLFGEDQEDSARRFIEMIDEFYDRGVKLIVSAAAEPDALYRGKRLQQEFERTSSRLYEMRTREYLGRQHQLH